MAAGGLAKVRQSDFAAGMFRGIARHLIPATGLYDALNAFYDDDGSVSRRAGSEYQSNAAFGASLRWIWDGQLAAGARTVFASPTAFGVLDADDVTPVSLGGSGLAAPTRAVVVGGLLFIEDGTIYGGSRKAADYSTGTVSVTLDSPIVTGAGTTWTGNVDAGMLLKLAGRYYVVKSVDGNTQVTLTENYGDATAAGQSYTLTRLGTAGSPYKTGKALGTIFNRLLVASGNRLDFSAGIDDSGNPRPHLFNIDDNHLLPGGVEILGVDAVRDTALLFTTGGVYALTGMAFDIVDAAGNQQHRLEQVNRDLTLWGKEGIATYRNQLVVPCTDGVWTVGAVEGPELLTRSIPKLYVDYVRAGHKPGLGAVYKSTYFLPILDASNLVVDLLTCRLDRPIETQFGVVFPWAHWDGHGGNVTALAARVGGTTAARQPTLLAASRASTARVLRLSGCFEPSGARKNDADATTHRWVMEGRDFATGDGNLNHVRRLRIRYELEDGGADNPMIRGYYSVGAEQAGIPKWGAVNWGSFNWFDSSLSEVVQLAGQAPEDTGRNPYTWLFAARARFIRVRLESTDPAAKLVLRAFEFFVRPSGKDR